MIELTRFNGERFVLNSDLIEMVECTPDTVIRLVSGKKLVVKEAVETVVERIVEYGQRIHCVAVVDHDSPTTPEPEAESSSSEL